MLPVHRCYTSLDKQILFIRCICYNKIFIISQFQFALHSMMWLHVMTFMFSFLVAFDNALSLNVKSWYKVWVVAMWMTQGKKMSYWIYCTLCGQIKGTKCVFPRVVMENEVQFSMKLTCFLIPLAEYFSEFFWSACHYWHSGLNPTIKIIYISNRQCSSLLSYI